MKKNSKLHRESQEWYISESGAVGVWGMQQVSVLRVGKWLLEDLPQTSEIRVRVYH